MENKEKSLGDVYDLVGEFMNFVKMRFDFQEHVLSSISLDLGGLHSRQVVMARDIERIKEDMGAVTGAIAELAEKVGVTEE
ncbi:hypothetical protein A2419_03615 [Candidatus Adlerbacteria bacterium RIFOXYC1_FULL_48_26]|uniref:Uncharacterized protein n=1 Tax=Candidatus Adlerbacteria bacterium RIFOXYC1_FULL_48_26 TaxID=1797247 RepID=A0A1F4Y6D3_9BACT|nr:MAG: hypothetical protein A2419_03615 [Candidatus Adlerbacteria bacterium RIFOXYC1_FULL_48_26]OGC93580.1 MAG: hypothetical protein A2389_00855 [Candidatus Adlerbacteria bacterium RIFOXYB1_FULL_48_10]